MLFISLMIKFVIIYLGVCIFKEIYSGSLKITYAWIFQYVIMLTGMVLLSLFNELTGINLMLVMLIFAVVISIFCLNKKIINFYNINKITKINFLNAIIIIGIVIFFVCLIWHNCVYYDTTEDAMTQSMTKIAFIQQHKSLFVKYNTLTINTFSNEWTGEINALSYLLFSGDDRMPMLGNVEILLFVFVVLYESIKIWSTSINNRLVIATYIVLTPVIVGLSMTIKSDLIAEVMGVLLVSSFLEYENEESDFCLFAIISCIGLAAASKIILVPMAGLFAISLVIYYFKKASKKTILPIVYGIFISSLLNIRYIINLIQYHNPFQRALNEKMTFSIENIINNISGSVSRFVETGYMIHSSKPWIDSNFVLNKGIGYGGEVIGIIIISVSIVYFLKSFSKKGINHHIVWPMIGGFLFVIAGTVWYNWSFRFLYPYILVLEMWTILQFDNFLNKKESRIYLFKIWNMLLLIMMLCNGISAFRYGQAMPYSLNDWKNLNKTQQKLSYINYLFSSDEILEIPGISELFKYGGKGLVLDDFSKPYYPFFGDNNCVYIDLVMNQEEAILFYEKSDYDFIAVATSDYNVDLYGELENMLEREGYNKYQGNYGAVFLHNR